MKFVDLFAGIGGFRLGMEQAGHKCVAFCEIDKFARASYKAIHDTKGEVEFHDITKVTDEQIKAIGKVDIVCGGFPCQAFSVAGKRLGFEDTRGTLFFEIARFAKLLKPRYLFLENVKGLLNHQNGETFETILATLDELGYNAEWQVLNSQDYVAQNRERLFIIGHLRTKRTRQIFPLERKRGAIEKTAQVGINILGSIKPPEATRRGERDVVHGTDGKVSCLLASDYKQPKMIAIPVLAPDRVNKRQNGRRFKEDGEPMFTLTTQDRHGILDGDFRIRKLTPRECWRLQGFPDWAFDRASEVNSDSQLYKQAGNSVTVPIIYHIAKGFKKSRR